MVSISITRSAKMVMILLFPRCLLVSSQSFLLPLYTSFEELPHDVQHSIQQRLDESEDPKNTIEHLQRQHDPVNKQQHVRQHAQLKHRQQLVRRPAFSESRTSNLVSAYGRRRLPAKIRRESEPQPPELRRPARPSAATEFRQDRGADPKGKLGVEAPGGLVRFDRRFCSRDHCACSRFGAFEVRAQQGASE